jgi:hypothetical protein
VAAPPTDTDDDAPVPAMTDDPSVDTAVEPSTDVERAAAPPTTVRRGPWYRRIDYKLVVASLLIAISVVMILWALSRAVTGNEAEHLPAAIEEITPVVDAEQVPQQATVIADLAAGYEGRFIIDDIALPTIRQDEIGSIDVEPGEQVDVPPGAVFEPGNATLTFTPGSSQAIDSFDEGAHTVTVVYWKTLEGEATARSYTWTFNIV